MTRKATPNTCDLCQSEMDPSLMSYTAQFNQKQPYGKGKKGEFVSSNNKADVCKTCFLKFTEGNFSISWKHMKQDKDGNWGEYNPQQTIEA